MVLAGVVRWAMIPTTAREGLQERQNGELGDRTGAWFLNRICLHRSAPAVLPVRGAQIARLQVLVTTAAQIRGGLSSLLQ
jgi:hypothetical protein